MCFVNVFQSQMNFSYIEHKERDSVFEERKSKRNALRLSKLSSLKNVVVKQDIASPLSDGDDDVERELHDQVEVEKEDEIIPQTVSDLRNAVKDDVEAVLQKKLKNIELGIDDSCSFDTGSYDEDNESADVSIEIMFYRLSSNGSTLRTSTVIEKYSFIGLMNDGLWP